MAASPDLGALKKAFAIFDGDDTSPEAIVKVLGLIGKEISTEQAEKMLAYVKQESEGLPPDRLLSVEKEAGGKEFGAIHHSVKVSQPTKLIPELFVQSFKENADRRMAGTRNPQNGEYEFLTYGQMKEKVLQYIEGMKKLFGIQVQDKIGVAASTRLDWTIAAIGNVLGRFVTVTLYPTLGPDAVEFILNQTQLPIAICSQEMQPTFAKAIAKGGSNLKGVIVSNAVGDASVDPEIWKGLDVKVLTFADVLKAGEGAVDEFEMLHNENDEVLFLYTSGTTGDPKGVIHTVKSYSHGVLGTMGSGENCFEIQPTDSIVHHLPMAHLAGWWIEGMIFLSGASLGYYSQDPAKLVEDHAILKPTIFGSVPRVISRVYDAVVAKTASLDGMKKVMLEWAIESKEKRLKETGKVRSLWDFVAFQSVRDVVGGRATRLITGAAPVAEDVLKFYQIYFGLQVSCVYGMSEVWLSNLKWLGDSRHLTNVGPPSSSGIEIRLKSVEEMDYFVTSDPPQGEVCFRGASVMREYHNKPELTKEVLIDGWMHSGDIGEWLPNGSLRIIDRKKNLFKLSQGEYVSPEKCEIVYCQSSFVAQAFVHGDSLERFLVCVVFLDPAFVEKWKATQDEFSEEKLKAAVVQDVSVVSKRAGLNGFEIAKAFRICSTPFESLNLLTPTSKLKRNVARVVFEKEIKEMYSKLH